MKRALKRILCVFAVFLILSAGVFARAEDILLTNPALEGEGVPDGWEVRSYLKDACSVESDRGIVTLISYEPNDLRLCQTVAVEENTAYTLFAEISVQNVMGGRGATLSIDNYSVDGCYIYSRNLLGSMDWTGTELTFRTGEGQTSVVVALRLGGYSELSAGTARFRSVRLAPAGEGAGAVSLSGGSSSAEDRKTDELSEAEKIRLRSYLHLFIVLAVVDAVILIFGFYRSRERISSAEMTAQTGRRLFLTAALAALALRSLLSSIWMGHDTDMGCWIGWGNYIAQNGPSTFYTAPGHEWYDYPPGYMAVLGLIARALNALKISPTAKITVFAYMLPAALADIATAAVLMRRAGRNGFSESGRLLLGCLYLFNPAVVMLSGVWGQIDSILTLFLLLSFLSLIDGKRVRAGVLYALAVMIKWQALIYGPVLACFYILHIRSKKDLLDTAAAVAAAFGVILLVSLPFRGDQSLFWVVGKFFSSAGGYRYASVEAYNFLALCGGNWTGVDNTMIPGVSYAVFGTAAILLGVTISLCMQFFAVRGQLMGEKGAPDDSWMLFLSAAFCMYMIFTFGQYMHERYVFPVMALLMMAYILTGKEKWLMGALMLSVTVFLNEVTAMYVISNLAASAVRGGREHSTVVAVCSFAETACFLYFARLCADALPAFRKGEAEHA